MPIAAQRAQIEMPLGQALAQKLDEVEAPLLEQEALEEASPVPQVEDCTADGAGLHPDWQGGLVVCVPLGHLRLFARA